MQSVSTAPMQSVSTAKRYTPEDLQRLPDGDRYELVDGHLVEHNRSFWACYIAGRILNLLLTFSDAHHLGWVSSEGTSFQCFPAAPERVRKADVSFIRLERLTLAQATAEGHLPIAPDLAVEVLSPDDLAYEVDAKVQDYLSAGVRLVWVVNPQARTIEVHRLRGAGVILRENDELNGEDVLPGFTCRVGDLFRPPPGVDPGA
jgi:Uma2 family endonuclease